MIFRSTVLSAFTRSHFHLPCFPVQKQTRRSLSGVSEDISVPCQSNGEITLNVHQPSSRPSVKDLTPRVIIYLPRGPLRSNAEDEAKTVTQLRTSLPSSHVVRINYRLDHEHQYPTPIHDTLAGFDFIRNNVLAKRAISRPGRADHLGKIAVCGELVGGGLATALALTECRIGEPGIAVAAINNALVDWVLLERTKARSSLAGEQSPSSTKDELRSLRDVLFAKPGQYFDPFASPVLFFRTPGIETPPPPFRALQDDLEHLSMLERAEHQGPYSVSAREHEASVDAAPTSRKASRRYPNPTMNLRLPAFRFSSGMTSPFADQTAELAHVVRQSCVRQSRQDSGSSSFGRKVLLEDEEDDHESEDERVARKRQEAEAEQNAALHCHPGLSLWDQSSEGRARLQEVAAWLRMKLT